MILPEWLTDPTPSSPILFPNVSNEGEDETPRPEGGEAIALDTNDEYCPHPDYAYSNGDSIIIDLGHNDYTQAATLLRQAAAMLRRKPGMKVTTEDGAEYSVFITGGGWDKVPPKELAKLEGELKGLQIAAEALTKAALPVPTEVQKPLDRLTRRLFKLKHPDRPSKPTVICRIERLWEDGSTTLVGEGKAVYATELEMDPTNEDRTPFTKKMGRYIALKHAINGTKKEPIPPDERLPRTHRAAIYDQLGARTNDKGLITAANRRRQRLEDRKNRPKVT